jgi:hypothetical protein
MMAAGADPSLRRLADAAAGPVRLAAASAGPVRLPGAGPVSRAQLYQRRRNVLRLTLKRLYFCWLDDGWPWSKNALIFGKGGGGVTIIYCFLGFLSQKCVRLDITV